MEASTVYYTDFRCPVGTSLTEKLRRLCIAAGIKSIDMDGKFVAIKMHFGELGNLAFLRPNYAKVVAATIPVLIISPLDDWFEARFYNYITVAAMLILYGVLFILVENRRTAPHVNRLEQITYREAFIVGVWQMLAIIPGTSRSGATIVGGLLLGLSRACVAEFTFFLAIPVMAGASLLKVVKFVLSGAAMTGTEIAVLVVGCVVAFVVSLAAIRFLMDYVKRHDFKFFGVYRIVLGIIVLAVAAVTAIF